MTTIIVIILAILVLLVVSLIFLGGTTGLGQKIQDFFRGSEATSKDVALQNCVTWCDHAKTLSSDLQKTSSFCIGVQRNVDINGDGTISNIEKKVYCKDQLDVDCSGVVC